MFKRLMINPKRVQDPIAAILAFIFNTFILVMFGGIPLGMLLLGLGICVVAIVLVVYVWAHIGIGAAVFIALTPLPIIWYMRLKSRRH